MAIAGIRRFLVIPVVSLLVAAAALAGSEMPASGATVLQKGMDLYVTEGCATAAEWATNATNAMQGIKSLGANSVNISFPFFTKSASDNGVFTANLCTPNQTTPNALNTPSPARIAVLVHAAKVLQLHVTVRPLMQEGNLFVQNQWRGSLQPTNKTTWFTSYKAMMKPYLQMAQANGVFRFVISAELVTLKTATQWPSVITYVKSFYKGQIVSDYTWRTPGTGGVAKTAFGVDAYPPAVGLTPTSTVAQILAKWNALFKTKPIAVASTLDEVGIAAVNGAYATPWVYNYPGGTFNQTIQVNWVKAACSFWKAHKLTGLYFWGQEFRFNNGKLLTAADPLHSAVYQPAALTAIKACFAA